MKLAAALILACTFSAGAQSLYERPAAPGVIYSPPITAPTQPVPDAGQQGTPVAPQVPVEPAPMPPPVGVYIPVGPPVLAEVSLYGVTPPEPRSYQENDFITIIVSERASLQRTQKEEQDKNYDLKGAVVTFPDLISLLELRAEGGRTSNLPAVDLNYDNQYEGEGKYKREDRLTARVTARVLEVKPNGTLLVEARTEVRSDNENQLIVISGLCRPDDITDQNTIQSSQLFNLKLNIQNSGDVRATANKGLIPRILETLFNF